MKERAATTMEYEGPTRGDKSPSAGVLRQRGSVENKSGDRVASAKEVGVALGLSKEWVLRIERQALEKFRMVVAADPVMRTQQRMEIA
jgi:DNA-directed RNA polymerase sigma subunit (sigma70/sigma32)